CAPALELNPELPLSVAYLGCSRPGLIHVRPLSSAMRGNFGEPPCPTPLLSWAGVRDWRCPVVGGRADRLYGRSAPANHLPAIVDTLRSIPRRQASEWAKADPRVRSSVVGGRGHRW